MPKRSINGWVQWWPVRIAIPWESRIVPISWGWAWSMTKDKIAALFGAVPTTLRPPMLSRQSAPYSKSSFS